MSALFVFVVSCVGIAELVPAAIASSPPHVTSIGTTKPVSTLLRKHESTPSSDSNTASRARPSGTLGNPMSGLGSAAGCGATAKATPEAGQGVTTIGDSIMIDAAPYLRKLLPGIVIDAQIGRQMFQAQAVTAHLKLKGELGRRVIIELGTSGSFTNEQLISLLCTRSERFNRSCW